MPEAETGKPKTKIYLTAVQYAPGWWRGAALAENGDYLAAHISSSVTYAKHDMGLTSDYKHTRYAAVFPDGYEVEWVDDPYHHEGWLKALALNKEQSGTLQRVDKEVKSRVARYIRRSTNQIIRGRESNEIHSFQLYALRDRAR